MNSADIKALLPYIIVSGTIVVAMLAIAFRRSHRLTFILTVAGLAAAVLAVVPAWSDAPRQVTQLLILDRYALYILGLVLLAAIAVAGMSYSYLELRSSHPEEFYLLLMLATLGAGILAASIHFASFFLGLEVLSISLYALAAYLRENDASTEAGIKYLILAALSSAFILFGMALVYAKTGSLSFGQLAGSEPNADRQGLIFLSGVVMILSGLGFKLAVVPFHLWTPDVYEGAPAPATAFIATVSKGGVFALFLRLFTSFDTSGTSLVLILTMISAASMFAGNLLALRQENVKRILAYSSIAHLGYLLVTILATGPLRIQASSFYLAAYFVTTLGAFGVVSLLSTRERDADSIDDYRGLGWRRPFLGAVFTAMLLSLAGIPLTAGFVAKFYIAAAGVGSALWFLVFVLVMNSVIGLYYYLRIVIAVYSQPQEGDQSLQPPAAIGNWVVAMLALVLVWLGVYPGPLMAVLERLTGP
jgi:NADH-quinone oxidoreductase subunit N